MLLKFCQNNLFDRGHVYQGAMGRVVFAALCGKGEIAVLHGAACLRQEKCSQTLEAPVSLIIGKFFKMAYLKKAGRQAEGGRYCRHKINLL